MLWNFPKLGVMITPREKHQKEQEVATRGGNLVLEVRKAPQRIGSGAPRTWKKRST